MLYIHTLKDLTPKTADIESIPIIREVRSRLNKPFSESEFHDLFGKFFPDDRDINEMKKASDIIEPAIEKIKDMISWILGDGRLILINLQKELINSKKDAK